MRLESFFTPQSIVPVAIVALLVPALARAEERHVQAGPTPSGSVPASARVATIAPADALIRARRLYTLGVDHTESKQWQQAYVALREAWDLKRHWQIALMLGWAEMELGKVRAAIAHLTFASADKEPKDSEYTKRISALLLKAESRLAHLRIRGVPAGVKLLIDGELVGIAPLPDPVPVDPGMRTVTAELGSLIVSQSVTVSPSASGPGQRNETPTVTLVWPKSNASGAATARPALGDTKPSLVPVVALGAAAGLGVVIGGVLMGVSVAKENEAAEKLEAVKNEPRPCRSDPCMRIDGLLAERDALGSAALGVWIGSAAVGALGAGVYLVQRRTKSSAAMTWAPVVSTNGAGLVVRGAF